MDRAADRSAGDRWVGAGMELMWDADTRLMQMKLAGVPRCTATHARLFLDQVHRWTAGSADGYGVLVDCANVEDTDPEWRACLYDYFRTGPPVCVAWFNTNPNIRVMVEMFVVGTSAIEGKVFASESEARTWLREQGIG